MDFRYELPARRCYTPSNSVLKHWETCKGCSVQGQALKERRSLYLRFLSVFRREAWIRAETERARGYAREARDPRAT